MNLILHFFNFKLTFNFYIASKFAKFIFNRTVRCFLFLNGEAVDLRECGRWFVRRGRGAIFVGTPNHFVKLFSPFGPMRYRKTLELEGNRRALSDPTWSGLPVKTSRFPFALVSLRGEPIADEVGTELAEALLWDRFKRPFENGDLIPARSVVPPAGLDAMRKHGVPNSDLDYLLDLIEDLRIPAGSAHGDAHQDNFITMGGKIRIIDWTVFEERSSPLFDLLYWYADRHRRQMALAGQPPMSLRDQVLGIPPKWQELQFAYPDIKQIQIYFVLMRLSIKFKAKRNPLKPKNAKICAPIKSLIEDLQNHK